MTVAGDNSENWHKPALEELGLDLLDVGRWERAWSLLLPFLLVAGFFASAARGWWPAAVACTMGHAFFTYGSVSHDLVHRTLRLPEWLNELLLTMIELTGFRSGHAYRTSHLHHHRRFPHEDDVEARAARLGLVRTLLDGMIAQPRLWWWALRGSQGRLRLRILAEGFAALTLLAACAVSWPLSKAPAVYALLTIAGSWLFPLITVYIPHRADGATVLEQTRWFGGRVLSLVAFDHLYHLEHHLYPQVPHHRWALLSQRLAPHLTGCGLKPILIWK